MDMNFLESLIYGLVSGLAEFLPISMQAQQSILLKLFGCQSSPLMQLFIRIAVFAALIAATKDQLSSLYREMRLDAVPRRRRRRQPDRRSLLDIRQIKTAFYPLLISFFFYPVTSQWHGRLNFIAGFLLLNGLILFIPQFFPSGNKDSRSVSRLEGVLFGLFAGLGVLPGVSRIGACTAIGSLTGADRRQALHWSLLLSIPALCFLMGFDIQAIILQGTGIAGFGTVIQCLLASATAFFGAYGAIILMRFLAVNSGFAGFVYYCWGGALFTFILFLTI
ncbi:MAG: undecaprenyl-diphosphate phosphatase [Oscillospiraceae bacterium]|nr:undecaprenyl-diphosphate phosphatase [Oscillospiraceae bacterium]